MWLPQYVQVKWEGVLAYMAEKHINVREMFMVATSALTFGHRWTGLFVNFHCDNESDVFAVVKGSSKNKDIMHLIRVLHYASARWGFKYEIRHIAGVLNVTADLASRVSISEFEQKCPGLTQVQPVLPPRFEDQTWEALTAALAHTSMTARRP